VRDRAEIKALLLDRLWRERFHTEPDALENVPERNRPAPGSIWEPAEWMRSRIARLPGGLLRLWAESGRGHILVARRPSQYVPGRATWHGQALEGLCEIRAADAFTSRGLALEALADLVDHLLGSQAREDGAWLADGHGCTPQLSSVAARLVRIHALGYATPPGEVDAPRRYFARTLALYLSEPAELNHLDPLSHRLYSQTLLSERWWSAQ